MKKYIILSILSLIPSISFSWEWRVTDYAHIGQVEVIAFDERNYISIEMRDRNQEGNCSGLNIKSTGRAADAGVTEAEVDRLYAMALAAKMADREVSIKFERNECFVHRIKLR